MASYRAGFVWHLNAHCGHIGVHEDHLYLGTGDMARNTEFLAIVVESIARPFRPLFYALSPRPRAWGSNCTTALMAFTGTWYSWMDRATTVFAPSC